MLRRYQQSGFTEGEIVEILEAYLSGLREYHHRFGRSYENLCLESAGIEDSKGRVYLRDPWLSQFASENRK